MKPKALAPVSNSNLVDHYRAFVARCLADGQVQFESTDRENLRSLSRLAAKGVATFLGLVRELPSLSPTLKYFGIWWLGRFKPPGTERVLLRVLRDDPKVRLLCSHHLGMMKGRRSIREFVRIGKAELMSVSPDVKWLEAVIHGLKFTNESDAVDILVTIYERTDLPGWLRGDAGDALGCAAKLSDRRTRVFRRVWATALPGLDDPDIEVQFWSMYVIMQLAIRYSTSGSLSNRCLEPALPRLREIAETDHRLAPGYWWPMSEEAKDAINAIETGNGCEQDASMRCLGHKERGETCKRY